MMLFQFTNKELNNNFMIECKGSKGRVPPDRKYQEKSNKNHEPENQEKVWEMGKNQKEGRKLEICFTLFLLQAMYALLILNPGIELEVQTTKLQIELQILDYIPKH